MTITDQKQFTHRNKLVIYTGAFVEFYIKKNHIQVHKIYGITELEKIYASTIENCYNFDAHQIIVISLVIYNAHIIFKDKDKFLFYVNNYIDQD